MQASTLPGPVFGGRRRQLPHRIVQLLSTRRCVFLLIALVVVVFFLSTPASRTPPAALAVQQEAYLLARHRRPTCTWKPWHRQRYMGLNHAANEKRVYLALNLYQNEEVLPTFFQELPLLLSHLGPKQVYVSVYENGSTDKTPELLRLFDTLLTTLGVPHSIVTRREQSHKDNGQRISVLAAARNTAMEPFYHGTAALALGGPVDEVLFINDIFHCAIDILEVLYQKRRQGMHQACAVDWDPGQIVYDRWILRAMSGNIFYRTDDLVDWFNGPNDHPKTVPQTLPEDTADRRRFEASLPLQVFSCWNGATVVDAAAFMPPHSIRFRMSSNDFDEEGVRRNVTEKASECFLSSVDLWKAGMGKIAIVPKASVAYSIDLYERWRKDALEPSWDLAPQEWISWVAHPPKQVAMQDYARWWLPERWAPWDEQ